MEGLFKDIKMIAWSDPDFLVLNNHCCVKGNMDFIRPLSIPFLVAYLLWARGIYRSKNSDLILGLILFIFSLLFAMLRIPHSGGFSFIGPFLIVFGIISLILKNKIKDSEKLFIKKDSVKGFGILAIVIGVLFSLVA